VPANKGDVSWLNDEHRAGHPHDHPGLALFYGGMVRSKNVLSLLMQVMIIFCVGVLMFAIYGYSMAFSEGTNQFVGGFGKMFLKA
jgi:Amt family ammonium transporter